MDDNVRFMICEEEKERLLIHNLKIDLIIVKSS